MSALASRRRIAIDAGDHDLRTCTLQHPDLDRTLAGVIGGLDWSISSYPVLGPTVAAIASHLGVEENQILLAAGSNAAIPAIVGAFSLPEGEVVLQVPAYDEWEPIIALLGRRVRPAFVGRRRTQVDLTDAVVHAMDSVVPTLVVLTDPHSPTGVATDASDIEQVVDVAASRGHIVVIDECYAWFAGADHMRLLATYPNLVLVRSLSKGLGLAGARLAAVAGSPELLDRLWHWRLEGAVSSFAAALSMAVLADPGPLARIRDDVVRWREEFTIDVLGAHPDWSAFSSTANFTTFAVGDAVEAERVVTALARGGVRTRNLSGVPCMDGCVRIGIGEPEVMDHVRGLLADG